MTSLAGMAERAHLIHDQDRVLEVASFRAFAVLDAGRTWTVVLHGDETASCSCGATICAHMGAALLAAGFES